MANSAADFLPSDITLDTLRHAARSCRGCGLYEHATQTVFGAGPDQARIVLVGEQPGDREDREGLPFVGPAGGLLDEALADADIPRDTTYVTNAVKHFKWTLRGKRRLHKKPTEREIDACNPWLLAEVTAVRPKVVVCLGTTALRAALGHGATLASVRGVTMPSRLSMQTVVTIHPSAVLRLRSRAEWRDAYRDAYDQLVADLAVARRCAEF